MNEKQKILITSAKQLNWDTQETLRKIEDELAKDHWISTLTAEECHINVVKKYLALTSLPFVIREIMDEQILQEATRVAKTVLQSLWKTAWTQEEVGDLILRPTMPTGNLIPKYMIIGDAPGVADGIITDHFDRVFVYGPSSHLLRKALRKLGIYEECWFTNLSKLATPKNRPLQQEEFEKQRYLLEEEICILQPEVLFVLGNNANKLLTAQSLPVVHVSHPSYYIRCKMSYEEYAQAITVASEHILGRSLV